MIKKICITLIKNNLINGFFFYFFSLFLQKRFAQNFSVYLLIFDFVYNFLILNIILNNIQKASFLTHTSSMKELISHYRTLIFLIFCILLARSGFLFFSISLIFFLENKTYEIKEAIQSIMFIELVPLFLISSLKT